MKRCTSHHEQNATPDRAALIYSFVEISNLLSFTAMVHVHVHVHVVYPRTVTNVVVVTF
jgi:hypothetical protein